MAALLQVFDVALAAKATRPRLEVYDVVLVGDRAPAPTPALQVFDVMLSGGSYTQGDPAVLRVTMVEGERRLIPWDLYAVGPGKTLLALHVPTYPQPDIR